MKKIFSFIMVVSSGYIFAQTVSVRENTQITFVATETISEKVYKNKMSAPFVVAEDVIVKGKVIIKKGTAAKAEAGLIVDPKGKLEKGSLRADIYETKAVDGTTIKVGDCWISTTDEQPHPKKDTDGIKVPKGAAIMKGSKKSCSTQGKYEIKVN